jgi:hypothetical protein
MDSDNIRISPTHMGTMRDFLGIHIANNMIMGVVNCGVRISQQMFFFLLGNDDKPVG